MSKNAFNLLIVPAVILIVWAFVAHLGILTHSASSSGAGLRKFWAAHQRWDLRNPYFGEFHEIFGRFLHRSFNCASDCFIFAITRLKPRAD